MTQPFPPTFVDFGPGPSGEVLEAGALNNIFTSTQSYVDAGDVTPWLSATGPSATLRGGSGDSLSLPSPTNRSAGYGLYSLTLAPAGTTGTASGVTSSTLTDSTATWTPNQFAGKTVAMSGVTGTVSSNSSTSLTLNASGWQLLAAVGGTTSAPTPALGAYQVCSTSNTVTVTMPSPAQPSSPFVLRCVQPASGGMKLAFAVTPAVSIPGVLLNLNYAPLAENWLSFVCDVDGSGNPTWYGFPGTSAIGSNPFADIATAGLQGLARYNLNVGPLRAARTVFVTPVASAAVSAGGLPGTNDSYTPADGDTVLLTAQANGAQNGLWTVRHLTPWERVPDYASGYVVNPGKTVSIFLGSLYQGSHWTLTNNAAISVDTTATTWAPTLLPGSETPQLDSGSAPSAGVATDASRTDHVHPRTHWSAADVGFVSMAFDAATISVGSTVTAGTLQMTRLHVPTAQSVTNVHVITVNGGSTLTVGGCFAALYQSGSWKASTPDCSGTTYSVTTTSSSATVTGSGFSTAMQGASYTIAGVAGTFTVQTVGSSSSLTMTATVPTGVTGATMTPTSAYNWGSSGLKTMALAGGSVSLSAGDAYVGWFWTGTTSPQFGRVANGVWANGLIAANQSRFGTGNTGLTTLVPGSGGGAPALSSVQQGSVALWAALS